MSSIDAGAAAETLDALVQAVGIDSQNPGPGEQQLAAWARRRLESAGCEIELIEAAPGRTNVVATVAGGSGPRLILLAHMDTVPVGPGWASPPLGGTIDAGRVWGRGAADMKAGLSAALIAVERLARSGRVPSGDVALVLTVDEESPEMLGASALLARGAVRSDDQVWALEPTGLRVRQAQVGVQWIEASAEGRMAHAGRANEGASAIHAMATFVCAAHQRVAAIEQEDPLLGSPRMTVGRIRGGVAPNVVPADCRADVDIRLVPGFDPDAALALARSAANFANAVVSGARVEVHAKGATRPSASADLTSLVARRLADAHRRILGRELPVGGEDGREAYTDATLIAAHAGISSYLVFGPGEPGEAHVADESVPVEHVETVSRIVSTVVSGW